MKDLVGIVVLHSQAFSLNNKKAIQNQKNVYK